MKTTGVVAYTRGRIASQAMTVSLHLQFQILLAGDMEAEVRGMKQLRGCGMKQLAQAGSGMRQEGVTAVEVTLTYQGEIRQSSGQAGQWTVTLGQAVETWNEAGGTGGNEAAELEATEAEEWMTILSSREAVNTPQSTAVRQSSESSSEVAWSQ